MFGKKAAGRNSIGSLIGAGCAIEGNVAYAGGIRIDGRVKGDLLVASAEPGMVVVSEQGEVEGDIQVAHLVVAGRVKGTIWSTELVELQPRAHVEGDVHYRTIEIHVGAVVEGRLVHRQAQSGPGGRVEPADAAGESRVVELKMAADIPISRY
jgi:cytoskeletal protein CcmA (bactofilin family)